MCHRKACCRKHHLLRVCFHELHDSSSCIDSYGNASDTFEDIFTSSLIRFSLLGKEANTKPVPNFCNLPIEMTFNCLLAVSNTIHSKRQNAVRDKF